MKKRKKEEKRQKRIDCFLFLIHPYISLYYSLRKKENKQTNKHGISSNLI